MKHLYLLICIVLISTLSINSLNAQKDTKDYRRKGVFLELLGNGLLATANFDMRFNKNRQDGLGFRVGIGGLSVNGTDNSGLSVNAGILTIPLEINYLAGKRRSALEAGLGLTPLFISTKIKLDDEKFGGSGSGTNGFLSLGYRYQPINKGFLFRINWTPIINSYGFSPAWFGISFGFGFR